jgi:DNA-binding transcriptional ArsR family regulator
MSRATEVDTNMAKALSHPVRVRVLQFLNERAASPSELAREFGLPVANVSYHVNALIRLGCLEEVETRHVRGALEHRFRAVRRAMVDLEGFEAMPDLARHHWASRIATVAMDDLRNALQSDSFPERPDQHFTWTRLVLDEQGWKDVYELLDETLDSVLQHHAASAARLADGQSGGPEVCSMFSMFHYQSPPKDA